MQQFQNQSNSFENCKKLKKIEIPENSELQSIGKYAFSNTSITNFFIAESINFLNKSVFIETPLLKEITISPKNKHFKYLDENKEIIVSKNDSNTDDFDTIFIASRSIIHAKIPRTIKFINSYAFENCNKLESIEFCEDSNLQEIGIESFSCSGIREIIIPKSVWCIKYSAFSDCSNLKQIIIEKGSKLQMIPLCMLFFSRAITKLIIPEDCKLQKILLKAFSYPKQLKSLQMDGVKILQI